MLPLRNPFILMRMRLISFIYFCSRQYGVTAPISLNPPTERDLDMTDDLLTALKETGFFEAEEESEKRYPLSIESGVLIFYFLVKSFLVSSIW